MNTARAGRGFRVWLVASLATALATAVALVAVAAFGASQAQAATALSITKSIKPKVVTVGEQQTYTITITNNTGARATDVEMRDPLPRNVRFIRASTSLHRPGSCGAKGGTVTCDLGNLSNGQKVIIKIDVKTTEAGRYKNTAFVTHTNEDLGATEPQKNTDSARHRAVKEDRDGGGKRHCGGVKAVAGDGARACVGGVRAGA